MTSSPSPGSRGRGPTQLRAETNARTLVGLQRVDAQLQQELDKLDRQAFTAVSNIANHQQAMKMSWRRLEAQRNSPKTRPRSRSSSDQPSPSPRRSLLTSNTTKLYVAATPQIYASSHQQLLAGQEDRETSREEDGGTAPTLARGKPAPPSLSGADHSRFTDDVSVSTSRSSSRLTSSRLSLPSTVSMSPYISSPYMYRRDAVKSEAAAASPPSVSPLASTATSSPTKLPPILSSSSQPSLVATTNKDTLLKVSHMMGLDSHSHGPKSFHGFYADRAHYGAVAVGQVEERERSDESGERGEEEEKKGGGELSLAQQFEQIRRCRYIRHYRPDGTAIDEPYGCELDQ